MSIFFDFEVGPTGRRFRRAVDQDKKDVDLFWNREDTRGLFYDVDIGSLIELSTLSICMIDENKEVTGFMALCDHPNAPGVDPAHWEVWVTNMFQRYFISHQTLFIHFVCCNDDVADFFLEEALVSIFLNDVYLAQIALVVPPGCPYAAISRHQTLKKQRFLKLYARGDEYMETYHYLLVAVRQDFCPRLKIRRAVEEDNDDINEILEKKCPGLTDLYGTYYLSEIVGNRPASKRQVIVAQSQDIARGVMCLNPDVNCANLQTMYELNAYHGLMKVTPFEKEEYKRRNNLLKAFGDPIMLGKLSPFDPIEPLEFSQLDDAQSKEKLNPRQSVTRHKRTSKVNFRTKTSSKQSYYGQNSEDLSDRLLFFSPSPSQIQDISVTCLLEEEPFDYEIVNIDSSLLALPNVSSYDFFAKRPKPRTRSSVIRNRRRSSVKVEEPLQIYEGESNAFLIELYSLHDEIDDRRGFDLLQSAFDCMKDYSYCIIRVPTADQHFSLLRHFAFVPTKPNVDCKYALYVAHRNSVMGKLRVRKAEMADIPQIATMLQQLDAKETIWTVEHNLAQKLHTAYVFVCGYALVGLAVLEPPDQIDFIRAKFTLDSYQCHHYHVSGQGMNNGFATLKMALVYPAFEPHYRFFTRELMRLSGSSALVWLTAYRNKWVAHKANGLATAMIPILPRKSTVSYMLLTEHKKISNVTKNLMSFSTWYSSQKFTSLPKVNVDTRIVIVGASNTALAFMNALLFSDSASYLTFTSVTFVSTNGLPYMRHVNPAAEMMFPRYRSTTDRFLKSTPYTYYVNVVHGTLVEIDTQEKFIKLENGAKVFYDLLFLLVGQQYQHPDYMEALLEKERDFKSGRTQTYIRMDVPRYIETEPQLVDYDTPDNLFIINHIADANRALNYVRTLVWHDDDNFTIIIYGATIEAYCCITALLDSHVPPENIVFVEPFPPENENKPRVPVFCNVNVDQTIREVLDTLHIKVYRSYYFQSWMTDFDNLITHVEFLSHFEATKIQCNAFFYYGKRGLSPNAFVAINKSGIAYDGGILIDHEFRTKDPSIYAAGPATRYYARYFAESKKHKYYNSFEIGQKLGAQIRNKLDPLFTEKKSVPKMPSIDKNSSKSVSFESKSSGAGSSSKGSIPSRLSQSSSDQDLDWRIPDFKKPLVWHCILPGNLQYLEVRSPGVKVPHYFMHTLNHNGFVMETFKKGYFKLHFTADFVVDGMTCLTPDKFCLENFKNLYGLSAVTLNNVHLRFTTKRLDDFYEFFRTPWAIYLYHEHLDELLTMVKELVPQDEHNKSNKGMTLEEALRHITEDIKEESTEKKKEKMRFKFEKSAHYAAITDYVIEWLSENDILLPMFLQPRNIMEFAHDLESHPAFKKPVLKKTKMNMGRIVTVIKK